MRDHVYLDSSALVKLVVLEPRDAPRRRRDRSDQSSQPRRDPPGDCDVMPELGRCKLALEVLDGLKR